MRQCMRQKISSGYHALELTVRPLLSSISEDQCLVSQASAPLLAAFPSSIGSNAAAHRACLEGETPQAPPLNSLGLLTSACYDDFSSTLPSSLPTSLPSNISITSMLSPSAEIKWFVSYFGKVFGWLVLQPTALLARLQIPSLPLYPFRRIAFDKNIQKNTFHSDINTNSLKTLQRWSLSKKVCFRDSGRARLKIKKELVYFFNIFWSGLIRAKHFGYIASKTF